MKYIIRWDDIVIKYSGAIQAIIHIALAQLQPLSKLTYTICYKFKNILIHKKITDAKIYIFSEIWIILDYKYKKRIRESVIAGSLF